MRATVIFDNFGPYHLARLRAASRVVDLSAIQVHAQSAEYAWLGSSGRSEFPVVTLYSEKSTREEERAGIFQAIDKALDGFNPECVFIPGWSSRAAFVALRWCTRNAVPAISMSESTVWDEQRSVWKEWIKGRIVGLCSAGLAGGRPHADYLVKLGMPRDRVFLGYDAVDNDYFISQTQQARDHETEVRSKHRLPENYFLASARFIEKKNLPRVIDAYARYRRSVPPSARPWDLVLLGDGAMRKTLESQVESLTLGAHVMMPGFKQYPDLPAYYAFAGAFVHASTTEQWGLVVNEAMASGLPVLVSNRCGCAKDLVKEGVNGFTFDPFSVEGLTAQLVRISGPVPESRASFGRASRKIIAEWGPARFAAGVQAAADASREAGPVRPGFVQRRLLDTLSRR